MRKLLPTTSAAAAPAEETHSANSIQRKAL